MKNMINKVHVEGLLYEINLTAGVTKDTSKRPNEAYIRGTFSVDTGNNNVVTIRVFEMERTSTGNSNAKYNTLVTLMTSKNVINDGADQATYVRVDSNLLTNDFVGRDNQIASPMQPTGGFIHIGSQNGHEEPKATFEVDIVTTGITEEMARDYENGGGAEMPTGNLLVKGYVFDFRNSVYPCTFVVKDKAGITFFKNLAAKGSVLTKIWGSIVSQVIESTRTETSAFGGDRVIKFTNTKRSYEIEGTMIEPYVKSAETITDDDIRAAIANRNLAMEALKTNYANAVAVSQNTQPQNTTVNNMNLNVSSEFDF